MPADMAVVVLDENGNKVTDVNVMATLIGTADIRIQKSDSLGIATFGEITAGAYLVSVSDGKRGTGAGIFTIRDNTSQQFTLTLYPVRRVYFAIYYAVKDNAFRRAAQTWEREVRARKGFNSQTDTVLMIEQTTEGDFKKGWELVYQESKLPGRVVVEGRLFTHASYMSNNDGLEFKPDESTDGTLDKKEMGNLAKLRWETGAKLVLHGCNTGKAWMRGWTPAQELATAQGVIVEALDGYGYFSTQRNTYSEIDDTSQTVYLYAYDRRRNATLWGDDSKVPELVFRPK